MSESCSTAHSTIQLNSELAKRYARPVTGQLQKLATACKNGKDHWRVVCYETPLGGSNISCEFHGFHYVWHIFIEVLTQWFASSYLEDNRNTIDYFNRIFGEDRINRWERAYEREKKPLIWGRRKTEKLELTKFDLKRILGAVGCVTKEDIAELLYNIQSNIDSQNPKGILYLNREDSQALVDFFKLKKENKGRDIVIEDLTPEEVDFFYDLLKPFSFSEASLQSGENAETGYDRGYTMRGLLKLAGKIEEVRNLFLKPACESSSPICDGLIKEDAAGEVILAKKIVGYYNPDGTMIRTKEGWYHVERKLDSAGMYMVYLKAIHQQNADRLYFLHTQSMGFIPWKWQPIREILTRDSGQKGIKEASELRRIIETNLQREDYKLKIYGYSLGAAGARRFLADTLARHGQRRFITELVTFAGLGIDKMTSDWIDTKLQDRGWRGQINITDYRNYGDKVCVMGESAPLPDRLIYCCETSQLETCKDDPKMVMQSYANSWGVTFQIYRSINEPHCDEIGKETSFYCLTRKSDELKIRTLIDNSTPNYETQRQAVAWWLSTKERFIEYLQGLEHRKV